MLIISLLAYNQLQITEKCIESIVATTKGEYKLILIDNASDKNNTPHMQALLKKYPSIIYHRNTDNIGYLNAHNKIFREYESDYFCVLNNDIIIYTEGWDELLITAMQNNPKLAIAGPPPNFGYLYPDGTGGKRPKPHLNYDYLEGWFLFINTAIIKSNLRDLFDETYMNFAFCEDSDLCLRVKQLGYDIQDFPISVEHRHNQTFKSERVLINFKHIETANKKVLISRWKYYLKYRNFNTGYKILIRRNGAIGDAFCVEPILRELKYKYPGCDIILETSCVQGYKYNNSINVIKPNAHGLGGVNFDEVIDLNLSYELTPNMHILDAYERDANVNLSRISKIPIYNKNLKWEGMDSKTILVNTDGSWDCRTWDLSKWKDFIRRVQSSGYRIVEIGLNNYLGIGDDKVGKLSLDDTITLMASAKELLCFDGCLLHMAQSVGLPSFSIWGCTNPTYRIHDWSICRTVWMDKTKVECAGCHHWRVSPRYYSDCSFPTKKCLDLITVNLAWDMWLHAPYNDPNGKYLSSL